MKKIAIFFVIIIAIVTFVSYTYLNYKMNYNNVKRENMQYNSYYEQEIYGTDLSTLINRIADSNIKNNVEKDEKGQYIDNGKDSIKMYIKFTDDNDTHSLEEIYQSGVDNFMIYYNQIKFKCTDIQYHQLTNKVSYMFFEQITD